MPHYVFIGITWEISQDTVDQKHVVSGGCGGRVGGR